MRMLETLAHPHLGTNSPIVKLMRGGAIAGVIKLTGAALAFLMFLAVSLVTDARQFGLFGAAFAAASLVSFFSTVGQQSVILRFWPEYLGRGDREAARALMVRSVVVAASGTVLGALILVLAGLLPFASASLPEWTALCLSAGILALGLGWSEFISAAMRAQGSISRALLPRDVIWRVLVIGGALVLMSMGAKISAVEATLGTGLLLLLPVLPQTIALMARSDLGGAPKLSDAQAHEFKHVTWGLWGVNALPPALAQATTLLVALILGPEIAGAVFVAERTTRLVAVAMSGINQAIGPEIAAAFHNGNRPHVQQISSLSALVSTAVAIAALLAAWMLGDLLLGMFQPSYATPEMVAVLVTFAAGAALASACGPVEVLLQLTGQQHAFLRILLIVNPIGIAVTAAATFLYGPMGAALGIAATTVAWNVAATVVARRHIAVDPSLLGLLRLRAAA
jgi:O-antigen/teichoic acid export membrane protein